MTTVSRQVTNRVITVGAKDVFLLDDRVSKLLDIIDKYGGTNPFPRFFIQTANANFTYFYSCTTKIPNDSVSDFDKEINIFRARS